LAGKDIVVIGASAGGIEALRALFGSLTPDLQSSFFVVLHTAPDAPGVLADILDAAGPLPARYAIDRERITGGRIYVAPPDHHLIVQPGVVRLTRGPRENRFRPAVDPLFRSAAQVYGPRVVGVILSGGLDDGTSGLLTIKQLGGTSIVQEPREAFASSMPLSALQHVQVDHRLAAASIGPLLARLAAMQGDEPIPEIVSTPADDAEVMIAAEQEPKAVGILELGEASLFACPECHGVLLQLKREGPLRFRCHTGHAYTAAALMAEVDEAIEVSLATTLRAIEERVLLLQHVAAHLRDQDEGATAEELLARAEWTQARAELVREALLREREPGRAAGF
jgi:two-component system, chemotaxis family, protein-glutamate methylesterase/glutaminase